LNVASLQPREVFGPAFTYGAAAVILAHNHPSGDPTPSPEDLAVTHHLQEAGRLLGVEVLDHLVIAADRFRSLREAGGL
jgi:DNA repair protein RadC